MILSKSDIVKMPSLLPQLTHYCGMETSHSFRFWILLRHLLSRLDVGSKQNSLITLSKNSKCFMSVCFRSDVL